MNSNELNQIKNEYHKVLNSIEEFDIINVQRKELVNKRDELNNLILLKQKLESNKFIRYYINVLKQIENINDDFNNYFDDELLYKIINSIDIKRTNGIYVYKGTFYDTCHAPLYKASYDTPNASYREYMDIEKDYSSSIVQIPIKKCDDFEKYNIVFYPLPYPYDNGNLELYQNLRRTFFRTCIFEGQDKAIEKILTLKSKDFIQMK